MSGISESKCTHFRRNVVVHPSDFTPGMCAFRLGVQVSGPAESVLFRQIHVISEPIHDRWMKQQVRVRGGRAWSSLYRRVC